MIRAALINHGMDFGKRYGLYLVLQFFKLCDQVRRQDVRPRTHDLPELHKGGAEFFYGKPHPLVHGGRFRRIPAEGKPYPGLSRKQFFQRYAKPVFTQDLDNMGEPLDLRDHAYLLTFVILKGCFIRFYLKIRVCRHFRVTAKHPVSLR